VAAGGGCKSQGGAEGSGRGAGGAGGGGGRGLQSSTFQLNLSQFWSLKPELPSTSKPDLSRLCD
jgi:hypothetical protein